MKIAERRLPNRRRAGLSIAVLLTLLAALGSASASQNLVRPRWIDPVGRKPTGFQEWRKRIDLAAPTYSGRVTEARVSRASSADLNVVEVVVNAEIYPRLTAELAQYTTDLQAAGYTVRIDTMRGMNPHALRALLQGISDIKGALLVGELPVAWYESDWGGSMPEEFPCDLYFADLNGAWVDGDGDGLYDDHTGNVAPEIWIGRLYARPLTWDDEVRLIKHYFAKNHSYRTGGLTLPDRGLCFNDEDWSGSGDCGMTALYPTVNVIEDARTTAPNYRTELVNGYEWIHVMSHSSAWGNTFKSSGGSFTGTVFNCEMYALQPHCNFYDLFCCSGARFTEENYSAGWEVFNDDWGLCAVGSSKTGSMIGWFEGFYSPMASGYCIGDAFKSWFVAYGEYDRDWHYGLTIIGDPTLKPRHGTVNAGRLTPDAKSGVARGAPRVEPLTEVVGAHPETDAEPAVVCTGRDTLWTAWMTGRTPANGRFDIYGARRTQSGWSAAMPIGNAYYWECDPALGIDNQGRPVCVWSRFEDTYHYNLYYSYWNGSSWSAAALISDDPSADMNATMSRDSSGRLWCFWESRRNYYADVWASNWNGSTWTTPVNVTSDSFEDRYPVAVCDTAGRTWVFYTRSIQGRTEIWSSCYTGTAWSRMGPISGDQRRATWPACCKDGLHRLWVSWQCYSDSGADIWSSYYNGGSWSTPARVSPVRELNVHPKMSSGHGEPWVVWQEKTPEGWAVWASRYIESSGWTSAGGVSVPGFNLNPSIACDERAANAWFLWQSYTPGGNWEINAEHYDLSGVSEAPSLRTAFGPRLAPAATPAHAVAELRYSLASELPARLLVFDPTGRLIRNLGSLKGAGSVRLEGLPAGAYFARLISGQERTGTRFILTR
jgi:hypothetical protein